MFQSERVRILIIVVSAITSLGEFGLGVFNFCVQTLQVIGNFQDIEHNIVNLNAFSQGSVCVQRNPELPSVSAKGVDKPWGLIGLGVAFFPMSFILATALVVFVRRLI